LLRLARRRLVACLLGELEQDVRVFQRTGLLLEGADRRLQLLLLPEERLRRSPLVPEPGDRGLLF
jgi:hypothetical protein